MSRANASRFPADRELVLHRVLDAPRDKVFRCWSTPELLSQWFTPKPWRVAECEMDFRTGGWNRVDMRGPEGEQHQHQGMWLEIVENERVVFTDAFIRAWEPSEHPFMIAIIDMADAGPGKTDYRVTVRHWSVAETERHKEMGFIEGWTQVINQIEAVARSL